jgi:hypothetical protein
MRGIMTEEPIGKKIKLLVAHENPDMDAIGAIWLFKRFGESSFDGAEYYFVHAGDRVDAGTMEAKGIVDDEIVHVDTAMGRFDHHQPGNTLRDSATLRVYTYLCEKFSDLGSDNALKRVVDFVNETDHFASYYWPEVDSDRYSFMMEEILAGLRSSEHFTDREVVEFGMLCFDGVYTSMKIRVKAEEDLDSKAQIFDSPWGKAMAIENKNDEVIKLAQKKGFVVVVRKDEVNGAIRIKTAPDDNISLKQVYEEIKKLDSEGTWYYHPSGHMLINGSRKHSGQVPTRLSLEEVVYLVKNKN